jgi:hypothetical protein
LIYLDCLGVFFFLRLFMDDVARNATCYGLTGKCMLLLLLLPLFFPLAFSS